MRKPWLVAALLALAASCGTETDDRSPTTEYVTAAIFRPSCGTAACHSSATGRKRVVLDTVAGVCAAVGDKGDISAWMQDNPPTGNRMPLDSPLPDADIKLVQRWLFPEGDLVIPPLGCP